MKVAIQGEAGSFHEEALSVWQDDGASQLIPCTSFLDVFTALESHQADAVIVAVENTVYGSINEVYQLIARSGVPIVAEIKLTIAQQLIGFKGADLNEITEIYSHPVALAQCQKTLLRLLPKAKLVEYYDTAAAVEYVKSTDDTTKAALASTAAARLHGLTILQSAVHDDPYNKTRFLALSHRTRDVAGQPNRTSLLVETNHQPGSLVEVLQYFSANNVNLVKLQSQPIIGQPWRYQFFIVADTAGQQLQHAVEKIIESGHRVTILGQYVAATD